jgi:hypothetical protein
MKRDDVNPMDSEEFKIYVKKIINALEDEGEVFFDFIREAFEYFTFSDTILEGKEVSLNDFEILVKKVENVLGKEDSIIFFRAVYDALPKTTVKYLGVIVSVFEAWKNQ